MAFFHDSLRSAIAAINPFSRGAQQQAVAGAFTSQLAIAYYLSSGILRKVIDIPAQDRTREWRDWQGADSDQITKIEDEEKRLGLKAKVRFAEVLRGLGGGALILALPGDLDKPARPNDKLTAVNVVSRWQITLKDIDDNMASPTYGEPRMFEINGGTSTAKDLHPSRVIAFRGEPLPIGLGHSLEDAFWGSSRLERVIDEVKRSDSAAQWLSELVKKAKLLRVGIAKLDDYQATDRGRDALAARIALIAQGENILNATVYNAGDGNSPAETINDYQISFAGMPQFLEAMMLRVAAVANMPYSLLMGQAPAGMNATGQHDAANWASEIASGQELELRPCLDRLDPHLLASAGVSADDLWWKFTPLWKPTAKEETERFKVFSDGVKNLADVNALPQSAFNAGVQSELEANGWLSGAIPILADMSEEERFGITPEPDDTDPSAIAEGGDPDLAGERGQPGSGLSRRRAANDKQEVGDKPRHPFEDGKRRSKRQRLARRGEATGFDPNQPRDRNGRWIPSDVRALLANAASGNTAGRSMAVGTVGERLRALAKKSGVTLRGPTVMLDRSSVRHAIVRHGNETRSGQKHVKAGDLSAAATILNGAKTIRKRPPSVQGVERFISVTVSKGQRTYAVFDNRRSGPALVTMWVRND